MDRFLRFARNDNANGGAKRPSSAPGMDETTDEGAKRPNSAPGMDETTNERANRASSALIFPRYLQNSETFVPLHLNRHGNSGRRDDNPLKVT